MATIREWHCSSGCAPAKAGPLFDALLRVAQRKARACPAHPNTPLQLQLDFDFGLSAKHSRCTVLGAFTSRQPQSWPGVDQTRVRFFPFLVVLQRHGKELAAWLPYWHLVDSKDGRTKKKYGQWAPFMDAHLFEELLSQAHGQGFFLNHSRRVVALCFVTAMLWSS